MKRLTWVLGALLVVGLSSCVKEEGLSLHYDFGRLKRGGTVVPDKSGNGFDASLHNGASVEKLAGVGVLNLGSDNGFLDMGSATGELVGSLKDFTVALYLYVEESNDLAAHGNFVWCFGNSDNMAEDQNGSMFLSARTTSFVASRRHWSGEQVANGRRPFPRGRWHHVAYIQARGLGHIYLDGEQVARGTFTLTPSELGATTHNFLGKSVYRGDQYLKGAKMADFRVYNRALEVEDLKRFKPTATRLQEAVVGLQLEAAAKAMADLSAHDWVSNLDLPAHLGQGMAVSWHSSNPEVLSPRGVVQRPAVGSEPVEVTLRALLQKDRQKVERSFKVTVLPWFDDAVSVQRDADQIVLPYNVVNLRSDVELPKVGIEGSEISWSSSQTELLSNEGKLLQLAPHGSGGLSVTLTATAAKGNASVQRDFEVNVAEDEAYVGYLFSYFIGNGPGEEAIFYALSDDGYNFKALNNNQPIAAADTISSRGGVRDPHILRGPDGSFYMVVTDLYVPRDGWSGNNAMVFLKSDDLINWTHSVVNIAELFPNEYGDVLRVWAPQSYYDEEKGKMMVYFSMLQPGGYDIIYYAYANADFTGLESAPQQLLYHPDEVACIDGDIVYKDGVYNLFFKTEGAGNGIKKAVSDKLTAGYEVLDPYLQQTNDAVEGACIYRLINTDEYVLMYDVYSRGTYQFTQTRDLDNFRIIDDKVSMDFHPRHGTVIPITSAERAAILAKWGR
ncbi:immunoglobulin-like domain-containing protein [Geofilum rhodophaeum]|uniref:immunoglobulin-like domain-containing protein n=1 Tax=Geofilum rhodophaeum TaxID=1965019 RepID=UPI000B52420B|nr:immunoglobulin-like domain-containing protein [Geofilum rhodophaeum]